MAGGRDLRVAARGVWYVTHMRSGERLGVPAYVFLEEKMGCGTGFCKGCPVQLREGGYKLVCTDGPLMPTKEIVLI